VHHFSSSGWSEGKALALYVNSALFPRAAGRFRKFLFRAVTSELLDELLALGPGPAADRTLFEAFAPFVVKEFAPEVAAYRALVRSADLSVPHEWYPLARGLRRRLVYHAGPTNSGKTYAALQRMREAGSGVYCAPLRLLAMEVYDSLNLGGVPCELVTGQEVREMPFSEHRACTMEMVSLERQVDVAVVDEIQMLGDAARGWAWTRAVQGVPAKEVHLCGDPSAVPLVRQMARTMGEELEVREYERFSPLEAQERGLGGKGYGGVKPGDCVVAFSRKEIFQIKAQIERRSGHRCCVVYGALPPETRRQQARFFNDPDSGFDVLVASDAVGMGLNLNIRRVLFHRLEKWEGQGVVPLSASAAKQIAGRAGRRNSLYPEGLYATADEGDLPQLRALLAEPPRALKASGLFPTFEQIELFAGLLPDEPLSRLLQRFSEECRLEGRYFLCHYEDLVKVAKVLDRFPALTLRERYNFCTAPVKTSCAHSMRVFHGYVARYSEGKPVGVQVQVPEQVPRTALQLKEMETKHQIISLWFWLAQRLGASGLFADKEEAQAASERSIALLNLGLESYGRKEKKAGGGGGGGGGGGKGAGRGGRQGRRGARSAAPRQRVDVQPSAAVS